MNLVSNPTSPDLEASLIKLEAVQDPVELWEAIRAILRSIFSLDFCCLNFSPFLATPPMLFRERATFTTIERFRRFCEVSPFTPYALSNPGIQAARLSDILTERVLLSSDYYNEFMLPANSRFEACLTFWDGEFFEGIVGLHRTADQGDFDDWEMASLDQLYPHFQNALRRVLRIHRERAKRNSLELLLNRLPLATIILDWDLEITYLNGPAEELCLLWNLGPLAARSLNPRRNFTLPQEIVEACRSLREAYQRGEHPQASLAAGSNNLEVMHKKQRGLRAQVSLLQMESAPLSLPMFVVRLESRSGGLGKNENDLIGPQLALWSRMSRSEQRVAWLAAQGHRNREIALILKKSTMTVKKQLQSVYRKLDVSGRSRLIALLLPGPNFDLEKERPSNRRETSAVLHCTSQVYEQNQILFSSLSRKLPT